ncbi:MAG: outer membrane beta-barrel protein [Rhodothermales bacterium]|nr:outer membrane beta-barrel protein [Rhodothermales bacterium]
MPSRFTRFALTLAMSMFAAALPAELAAQPRLGMGAGASYQQLALDAPLPEWSDTGLLFPTGLVFAEWPLSGIDGPLGERLHVVSGLRYNRQSGQIDWAFVVGAPAQEFTGTFTLKQHFVSVPLWLRLDLGRSPLFVLAGPEVGLLVGAKKESRTLTPEASRSSQEVAVGDELRRVNVALRGGLGAAITPRLRLVASYVAGLSPAKRDAEQPVLISDWQTRELELLLLVRLLN